MSLKTKELYTIAKFKKNINYHHGKNYFFLITKVLTCPQNYPKINSYAKKILSKYVYTQIIFETKY